MYLMAYLEEEIEDGGEEGEAWKEDAGALAGTVEAGSVGLEGEVGVAGGANGAVGAGSAV